MKSFKSMLLLSIIVTIGTLLASWAGSLPENREDKYVLMVIFISATVIATILQIAFNNNNVLKKEIEDLRTANHLKDEELRKITENRDGLIQQCGKLERENREQQAAFSAYFQNFSQTQWQLLALEKVEQQEIISRDVRRKLGQEERQLL